MRRLSFRVPGIPAPQGSKRHVGHGRMIESSKAVGPWRESIRAAALAAMGDDWPPITGPCMARLDFLFPRPKSHFGTGRNAGALKDSAPTAHIVKPDIDKLTRAALDALTSAGAWRDDGQVIGASNYKRYCDWDEAPGLFVSVWGWE